MNENVLRRVRGLVADLEWKIGECRQMGQINSEYLAQIGKTVNELKDFASLLKGKSEHRVLVERITKSTVVFINLAAQQAITTLKSHTTTTTL